MEELNIFLDEIADVYNFKLPNPSMLLYYQNLKERKLWIESEVCDLLLDFEKHILNWNYEDRNIPIEDRKPIYIYIYTGGGDTAIANSFISVIKMSNTPIYTVNMGRCMSAGTLIFLAGDKRFVMPNSQMLIHQGSIGGLAGATNQIFEAVKNMEREEEKIKQYILSNSKISEELYSKNYKSEWFLTADEAVEYGVADKIVADIKEIY